jgi:uncharacterized phage-associated protein
MARVLDVAKYILERQGRITTLKLQKLVYYAQVWAIVDEGAPLFPDAIKAWGQGPVVPVLFHEHKGRQRIEADSLEGDSAALTDTERDQVDRILAHYGGLPSCLSEQALASRASLERRTQVRRTTRAQQPDNLGRCDPRLLQPEDPSSTRG